MGRGWIWLQKPFFSFLFQNPKIFDLVGRVFEGNSGGGGDRERESRKEKNISPGGTLPFRLFSHLFLSPFCLFLSLFHGQDLSAKDTKKDTPSSGELTRPNESKN
jgi:hypothetical protein